ncbi:MAG: penicillin-binding protein 2 [Gammaproteobacteria bacterium]|nr:penicillin-binding protein 2 [Gammaproteobacteria bacterium]
MKKKIWLIKDPQWERRLFLNRSILGGGIALLLVVVLAARLYYLQVVNHDHFSTLSANNRLTLQPLPPTRGLIFDQRGVVVAENIPSYTLEVVREQVADLEITLQVIATLIPISEDDLQRFNKEIKRKRRFDSVPLRFKLSDEEVARIAVNRHLLPGVDVHSRLVRSYPFGMLTAHSVGYVGRINEEELQQISATNYAATTHIGKLGVEKSHERYLHGKVGMQQVETNARGRIMRVIERQEPTPGENLHLNIDLELHRVAEAALGSENGALVAINPNNGAVLALVSKPSYDTNLFVNGISSQDYQRLLHAEGIPLFNRALRGRYPPGSTTKPIIGLAGLEYHQTTPNQSTFCPGWFSLEGSEHRYRDWNKYGHGSISLKRAIVESCDVYFYSLSLRLGIDQMSSYLRQFGLGLPTGIDIGDDLPGLIPDREWKRKNKKEGWYQGETLITAIGQGFTLATPLQLANATATLANNGIRFRPQVVKAMENPDTNHYSLFPNQHATPEGKVTPLTPSNLRYIQESMIEVIHGERGTARRINPNSDYRIAGKTGTSQVFTLGQQEKYVAKDLEKKLRDHALFIAYAPADDPQIAIAVIVENGGGGGSTAAPIAAAVISAYLKPISSDALDESE